MNVSVFSHAWISYSVFVLEKGDIDVLETGSW